MEADAHFHSRKRNFPAPGLEADRHSGACRERCSEKVVRIGTGRHDTGAIRTADRKLGCSNLANERTMFGQVACDDNFSDFGCLFL